MNSTLAKYNMVEKQIRPLGIENTQLLNALHSVDRENFFPDLPAGILYADLALPYRPNHLCMRPSQLARLLSALQISETDHVLLVGNQSGYPAAITHQLTRTVSCVTEQADFLSTVCANQGFSPQITVLAGPIEALADTIGTFDAILALQPMNEIPLWLNSLLKPNGRGVVITGHAPVQQAQLIKLNQQRQATTTAFFEVISPPQSMTLLAEFV